MCTTVPSPVPEVGNVYHRTGSRTRGRGKALPDFPPPSPPLPPEFCNSIDSPAVAVWACERAVQSAGCCVHTVYVQLGLQTGLLYLLPTTATPAHRSAQAAQVQNII
jgi:hypothetical protein